MSTQARHDGDFIVPKRNPPIQNLNPIVRH